MSEAKNLDAHEKRKLERCPVTEVLEVFDVHSERQLGRLVDITQEGMMITSQNPIMVNRIFQLLIPLPAPLEGCNEIRLGVESLWSRESHDGACYWTGFHVICISDQDRACIERLFKAEA
ncbi:MAG: PilZ domain-containing protein [Gammaproteobacteria bacterium]|nr:PilZ domain-containing protein [Gammaproteobacteria bacterium]